MALGSLGAVFYDIVANDMTGAGITSSRAGLMALGAAFTGIGAASASMVKDVSQSFLEFDNAMTEVKALGGLTSEQFNSMKNAAFELSSTMPITATDFANSMYLMVSVGYDYQTMMATIPEAAKLAVAGSMEMAEATNAIINVMGAYGEETYSATEITKVFANAVGLGKYEMTDFMTEIMKNIGVASQLGIEFSDLAAYNIAIQNSFTNAEEAGTSFNRMLVQLTDPKTVDTLRDMGIAVTDNEGKFRDLTDILGDLKTALSFVKDDAERAGIVTDLFGTYGQRAAFALMDQVDASNDASIAYAAFEQQVSDVNDEMKKLEEANDSLSDSLSRGDLRLQGLKISRDEAILNLEKLTKGTDDASSAEQEAALKIERAKLRVEELNQQIEDLTKTQEENKKEIEENNEKISEYSDQIADLETTLKDTKEQADETTGGIKDLGDGASNSSGKITELKKKMEDLNLIEDQTDVKLNSVQSTIDIANNKADEAKIAFGEAMAPAMIIAAEATSDLAGVLTDLPEPLQVVGGLGIYAAQGLSAVGPALMSIAALKMLGLGGIISSISASLSGLGATLSGAASTAGAAIGGSIITGIAGGIALGLGGVWVLLKTGVLDAISGIGRAIESSPVGSMIMDSLKIILAPIGSLGAGIIALVQGDLDKIPEVMAEPFNQAGEAIGRNIDRIKEAFSGIGTTVTGGVQALGGAVQGMINSFSGMGSIAGYAGAAFAGIGGAFSAMAGQVSGVFSQMFDSIRNMIGNVASGFYSAGANLITSMVNGIVAAGHGIIDAIAGILRPIADMLTFHSPAKTGPLSQEIDWGSYLTGSMTTAAPEVAVAASTNLAAPAATGIAGGVGGSGAGGGGGTTSITIAPGAIVINGAGENAEEIANQVIAKLGQQMASKRQQLGYRTTT